MADPAGAVGLTDGIASGRAVRPSLLAGGRWIYVVWGMAVAAVGLAAIGLALVPGNRSVPEAAFRDFAIPDLTAALLFSPIGAWIAVRRPRNAMGWLMLIMGVGAAISFFTTQYAAAALISRRDTGLPLGYAAAVAAQIAFIVPNVIARGLILYAFPDGQLATRAGRALLVISAVAAVAFTVAALAVPYPWYEARPEISAPLAPELSSFSSAFYEWFGRLFAPITVLCTLALVWRLRHSESSQRGPLLLFTAAACVSFVQLAVVQAYFPDLSEPIWLDAGLATIGLVAMAGATVIAVLRYRLWDIDVIVRRSLVFGSLTACLAAAYLGIVAAADALLSGRELASSLAAAVFVAAVAVPLRTVLQRGIDRMLYGDRSDPDAAIARLGRRLGAIEDIDAVLQEVAGAIATSLRIPYAALSVMGENGMSPAATWGHPVCGTESVELTAHGGLVGRLEIGCREPGVSIEGADRRLLEDLARQAALAVAIVQRSRELQFSRQRLVGAREEERRRLRRDLHDGLGPALAVTTLRLDEAADLIDGDPAGARRLLQRLRENTQHVIADLRRLVYQLRPPALDELGLIGALRQYAENLSTGSVAFEVHDESTHAPLPAAVEVALWRIATEAMTNVVRHADASHCVITIRTRETHVELEVADDGRGTAGARPGIGLIAMRERAAELGGRCTLEPGTTSGTRLTASVPTGTP